MYSLAAVLGKEPVVIAGAVRTLLYVLILGGVLHWDAALLAAVALALEVVLGLFVRGSVTSSSSPILKSGTVVTPTGGGATTTVA